VVIRNDALTARGYLKIMAVFDFPSRIAWALLAITGALAYGSLMAMGVTIQLGRVVLTLAIIVVFLGGSVFYTRIRPDRRLAVVTAATGFILAFAATTGVLTYPAAAIGAPTHDGMFMAFERMIGIDWPALVNAMTRIALLNTVLALAYLSSLPQIAITILVLGFADRHDRLAAYLSLLVVTLMCTVVLSALVPLYGPIASYGLGEDVGARIVFDAKSFLSDFQALHQGRFTSFDLAKMGGIVTFPSFHCVLAVLTAWALAPVRRIGVAAIILNGVVVVSSVPEGGHYIADIPAGLALGFLAIAIWARTPPRSAMLPALATSARQRPSEACLRQRPRDLAEPARRIAIEEG
jgi:PAP2 superfamily